MSIRPLVPALAEKALKELNEDPQRLEESLHQLKQWIMEQSHLRVRTDSQWLAAFLRGCKFRQEQTRYKIDLYFSFRSKAPYLYSVKYFEPKVMDILNLGCTLILQQTLNPADPRVVIFRIGQYNPREYSLIDILAVLAFQYQIAFMEDDNLIVAGSINVVDLGGTRFGHYTQIPLRQLRNLVSANQDSLPIRIKSIHFVNAPSFFAMFLNLSKKFLTNKVKQRVMVHSDMSSFHKYVPREILPEEYGGTGQSIQDSMDYWKQKICDYSSFFKDDLKYGSDESKRRNV